MPLKYEHQEWLPILYEDKEYFPIYYEQLIQTPQLYGFGPWLILDKHSKLIIGDIGFKGLPQNGSIDLGYSIVTEKQGQGFATEATNALCAWALQSSAVHSITASCFDWNLPSIAVLQKCKFIPTSKQEQIIHWNLLRF